MNRSLIIAMILSVSACSTGALKKENQAPEVKIEISSNAAGKGPQIIIDLSKGESFYYPLIAVWIEDEEGKYIQSLFVSKSVATGVFKYSRQENNKWITDSKRAPQTLPYWAHKRGIKAADGLYVPDSQTTVPDAYTGASPIQGFILTSRADSQLPRKYKVMLEINQNWDWNEYWTNDKYPEDENYKMSCQPAVIYEAKIDAGSLKEEYIMSPVGHSHYSGKTGELFPDLSTLTTALKIAESISVRIR